ncbi:hypothetical protein CEUSTIGMA_g2298.t1 [Chlamydomonas eustigma]|uniref:Uncharacterized protein n=1 Tax=Chlamydomonas eustigma TaxID=1157962 RepID=A0A250WW53_9CHLO|nr:hypothetical protein CEUSTIGMA_g2298.t1 [Chlamydomonas eustigma]|eukprot:GAX74852.1 hypothetical protein CEUSTIGMA_g2298.t1 [Chlamydomonas eustigma]
MKASHLGLTQATNEESSDKQRGDCPAWIKSYIKFQEKEMSNNSSKVLAYSCCGRRGHLCGGIAERILAMMEAAKLAEYSQRVVAFQWCTSGSIERMLQPNLIDWRLMFNDKRLESLPDHEERGWDSIAASAVTKEKVRSGADAVVRIKLTNNLADKSAKLPRYQLEANHIVDSSCLFHALFRPSSKVEKGMRDIRRLLFGSEDTPYLAVDLQLSAFEAGVEKQKFTQFTAFMTVLSCARILADINSITAPILLLTDHPLLQQQLRDGLIKGFVTTPRQQHGEPLLKADGDLNSAMEEVLLTGVESLGLLGSSKCLITSPTDSSRVSELWGRHRCVVSIEQCISYHAKHKEKRALKDI